ncbi:50S ribosomal protein L10 [Prolixibacter sp. SD074]|uniref:50S ribosomal protein L10 n=1 Tax=Prolixibacter sp. SD074 TaxID=2652391 RepID=UPI0012700075|nr:50S ribosomal protein L10 [Prolixibacter sp. SD074]GET27889.1 50S ribosomal protein L10 [Prolixibacter sp. SD074]
MKRSEKIEVIDQLTEQINSYSHFYLADTADLNAEKSNDLRRLCHKREVKLIVVKNTLLRRALENSEKEAESLYDVLKGNTSILFCNTGNVPARLIKEFSKVNKKPVLKGAYVEESTYIGADQLDVLVNIKSKEELLADVIALLQSPAKNLISALQSGGTTISGVLKTLEERNA